MFKIVALVNFVEKRNQEFSIIAKVYVNLKKGDSLICIHGKNKEIYEIQRFYRYKQEVVEAQQGNVYKIVVKPADLGNKIFENLKKEL